MTENNRERRTALVTGGSRGIGRAISLRLARDGFHVVINYIRDRNEAKRTLTTIIMNGGSAELSQFDVSDVDAVQSSLGDIMARHQIDVLVLNAGIRKDGLLALMTDRQWREVIEVNLLSFLSIVKPVVRQMLLNRHGSVIVISSTSAQAGLPGQANYAASKAGLIGATKSLALECAKRNVLANVVAPGYIETDMTKDVDRQRILASVPMQRLGRPEEVAGVVSFLASEEARYITGQVIAVNGGAYM
ncbi:MAG: 3-oxoacyl-ACP reductase FabG [Syntrophorhabdales bacterium]|jgi:3-oxoacyl-[acyl-carrier protein] reductase